MFCNQIGARGMDPMERLLSVMTKQQITNWREILGAIWVDKELISSYLRFSPCLSMDAGRTLASQGHQPCSQNGMCLVEKIETN